MKICHTYDHLRNEIMPALKSKQEEFALLGYGQVNENEIWEFLKKKKWKKAEEEKRISEIIQDIFSIKVGEFFNYATVEAFKEADFAFDDEEELRKLLK